MQRIILSGAVVLVLALATWAVPAVFPAPAPGTGTLRRTKATPTGAHVEAPPEPAATAPRPPTRAATDTAIPTPTPIANRGLKRPFRKVERFIDLRDLLANISQQGGFSLMVGQGVRGNIDEATGTTLEEVLNQALIPRGFEWRLYEDCLYVGERGLLEELWKYMNLPLKAKITRGKKLNAEFRNIDLAMICGILRQFSGIDIRTTDHISGNMTLRIIDMPWERVLLGIVYLNGYRMMETDFSIVISP